MKRLLLSIVTLAAASSFAVGFDGALAANHAAHGATVAVAGSNLGRILVNGSGRTLYLFQKDKHGKSTCTGACASFWPPLLTSGKPLATAGAKASLLGTIKRADGRLQVTYNHHPLYTFVKDTKKGQTNGEGVDAFGAEWNALAPAGGKVEDKNDAPNTGADQPPAAPGGYSY